MRLEKLFKQIRKNMQDLVRDLFDGDVKYSTGESDSEVDSDQEDPQPYRPDTKVFIQQWKKWFERIPLPLMDAAIDSLSLFYLINIIAEGYPTLHDSIMRFTARYLIPISASLGALTEILKEKNFKFTFMPYDAWKGGTSAINLSAFLTQFIFFITADIARALKHESNTHPIFISDVLAWSLIASAGIIGSLEGLRTYYHLKAFRQKFINTFFLGRGFYFTVDEKKYYSNNDNRGQFIARGKQKYYFPRETMGSVTVNQFILAAYHLQKMEQPPSRFMRWKETCQKGVKKAITSSVATKILNGLIASSTLHNLISEIGALTHLPSSNPWGQAFRYSAATGAGVIVGAFAGTRPKKLPSTQSSEAKGIKAMDFSFNVLRVLTLLLMFYRLCLSTPQARKTYGKNTFDELIIFWSTLPFFIFLAQLGINGFYNWMYNKYLPSLDLESNANIKEEIKEVLTPDQGSSHNPHNVDSATLLQPNKSLLPSYSQLKKTPSVGSLSSAQANESEPLLEPYSCEESFTLYASSSSSEENLSAKGKGPLIESHIKSAPPPIPPRNLELLNKKMTPRRSA